MQMGVWAPVRNTQLVEAVESEVAVRQQRSCQRSPVPKMIPQKEDSEDNNGGLPLASAPHRPSAALSLPQCPCYHVHSFKNSVQAPVFGAHGEPNWFREQGGLLGHTRSTGFTMEACLVFCFFCTLVLSSPDQATGWTAKRATGDSHQNNAINKATDAAV